MATFNKYKIFRLPSDNIYYWIEEGAEHSFLTQKIAKWAFLIGKLQQLAYGKRCLVSFERHYKSCEATGKTLSLQDNFEAVKDNIFTDTFFVCLEEVLDKRYEGCLNGSSGYDAWDLCSLARDFARKRIGSFFEEKIDNIRNSSTSMNTSLAADVLNRLGIHSFLFEENLKKVLEFYLEKGNHSEDIPVGVPFMMTDWYRDYIGLDGYTTYGKIGLKVSSQGEGAFYERHYGVYYKDKTIPTPRGSFDMNITNDSSIADFMLNYPLSKVPVVDILKISKEHNLPLVATGRGVINPINYYA